MRKEFTAAMRRETIRQMALVMGYPTREAAEQAFDRSALPDQERLAELLGVRDDRDE